jgi:predicted NBD/HSP70 family sugar kinase
MRLKGDQSTTRALNRRLVLDFLHREGGMSRTALTDKTALSPASISGVVAELIAEGFVTEGAQGQSSGGRRPTVVQINYGSRFSIGIKLMQDKIEATLTDLAITPIDSCSIALPDTSLSAVLEACAAAVSRLMPMADHGKLAGVGLAMPGLIDAEQGRCITSPRIGWENVPIAAELAKRLGVRVWVDNDVNTYAIAQQLVGFGRGRKSMLVMIFGTGVGAALVINNQIHRGAHFAAGEIAFVKDIRPAPDSLSWNGLYSEPAMCAAWHAQERDLGRATTVDLAVAAVNGDDAAIGFLNRKGFEVGQKIVGLIHLIDPEVIVIGGESIRFGPAFLDPLRRAVREFSNLGTTTVEVDWLNDLWSRGAAALAVQRFFDFESVAGLRAV